MQPSRCGDTARCCVLAIACSVLEPQASFRHVGCFTAALAQSSGLAHATKRACMRCCIGPTEPCCSRLQVHSPTKPVLVFVASRRQTRLTALDLISHAAADERPTQFLNIDPHELQVGCFFVGQRGAEDSFGTCSTLLKVYPVSHNAFGLYTKYSTGLEPE